MVSWSVAVEQFLDGLRPRLARAFVAAYGAERGHQAVAEAIAYAWEHAGRLAAMGNPAGYLFRVGQSRSRPRKAPPLFPPPPDVGVPWLELSGWSTPPGS